MIRVLAALLIVFSLYFLAAGLIVVNQGLQYWRESVSDLRIYQNPELRAASCREHAFESFAIGFVIFLVFIADFAIGVGLWRFRGWPRRATAVLGSILLVAGLVFACWFAYRYQGDTGAFPCTIPGLLLIFLFGFIRSGRSVVVCSQAFRDARAEVRGKRDRSALEQTGS